MRGYPLAFASAICCTPLACGSGKDASGSTATTTTTTTGSTGFPVSTSSAGSDSSTGSQTGTGTTTGTTDPDVDPCSLCEELEVCHCPCDAGDFCCECVSVPCVEDSQCDAGERCAAYDAGLRTCVPDTCEGVLPTVQAFNNAAVEEVAGVSCLASMLASSDVNDLSGLSELMYVDQKLEIEGSAVTNLTGLEKLEQVEELILSGNPALSAINGLSGLTKVEGGEVRNNPALPVAEIESLLAGVEGGDSVIVCGNLDQPPC